MLIPIPQLVPATINPVQFTAVQITFLEINLINSGGDSEESEEEEESSSDDNGGLDAGEMLDPVGLMVLARSNSAGASASENP